VAWSDSNEVEHRTAAEAATAAESRCLPETGFF